MILFFYAFKNPQAPTHPPLTSCILPRPSIPHHLTATFLLPLQFFAPSVEAPHVDFVAVELEGARQHRDERRTPLLVPLELGLQAILLLLGEAAHAAEPHTGPLSIV